MKISKAEKTIILGDTIRRLRKSQNYSQEQFSKALGISVATLSSYETGKTAPSGSVLIKISTLLGISPSEILKPIIRTPEKNISDKDAFKL